MQHNLAFNNLINQNNLQPLFITSVTVDDVYQDLMIKRGLILNEDLILASEINYTLNIEIIKPNTTVNNLKTSELKRNNVLSNGLVDKLYKEIQNLTGDV